MLGVLVGGVTIYIYIYIYEYIPIKLLIKLPIKLSTTYNASLSFLEEHEMVPQLVHSVCP